MSFLMVRQIVAANRVYEFLKMSVIGPNRLAVPTLVAIGDYAKLSPFEVLKELRKLEEEGKIETIRFEKSENPSLLVYTMVGWIVKN